MIIKLDGEQLEVTEEQELEMLIEFQARGVEVYDQQGLELQLLAMPFARWILAKMETAMRKKVGRQRAKEVCRPPKKSDPVIFLTCFLVDQLRELLRYAEINVTTDGERHVSGFALRFQTQDKAGGSMVSDGNEREREDNRIEVS